MFALTGHAPAGGIVMAIFGDYRIMPRGDFKTGLNEAQVGLVAPVVAYRTVARLTGPRVAERILVATGGRPMKPPIEGHELGIIGDEVAERIDEAKHVLRTPGEFYDYERYLWAGRTVEQGLRLFVDNLLEVRPIDDSLVKQLEQQLDPQALPQSQRHHRILLGVAADVARGQPPHLALRVEAPLLRRSPEQALVLAHVDVVTA